MPPMPSESPPAQLRGQQLTYLHVAPVEHVSQLHNDGVAANPGYFPFIANCNDLREL